MARLFGTDGVRGLANRDITPDLAMSLGTAVAKYVVRKFNVSRETLNADVQPVPATRPVALIGRDTRVSGDFLTAALIAGLTSAGMDVKDLGVLPTPAVAYLTSVNEVELGVMISASHNPYQDNGIKFFSSNGRKLPDAVEDEIQALMGDESELPVGDKVGRVLDAQQFDISVDDYIQHLITSIGADLQGLKIVVDCANGAASSVGAKVLSGCGADVVAIHNSPDGYNINENCGSTHIEVLASAVVEQGADFGVAYDGDADRCLAVDARGQVVDGDKIMGLLALDMHDQGKLAKQTLVVTVMSNLGLILAMREAGIKTIQTAVGDRYVLEAMVEGDYNLGGEQSGHVIASDYATTGDGVLTSLLLANYIKRKNEPLEQLATAIERLPQTLINVKNVDKSQVKTNEVLNQAIAESEAELADTGRVLLRASGTEALVRVMVEASTQEVADRVCERLAGVVKRELSL